MLHVNMCAVCILSNNLFGDLKMRKNIKIVFPLRQGWGVGLSVLVSIPNMESASVVYFSYFKVLLFLDESCWFLNFCG